MTIQPNNLIKSKLNKINELYDSGYPSLNVYWEQQSEKRNEMILPKWNTAMNSILTTHHALDYFVTTSKPYAQMIKELGHDSAKGEYYLRLFGAFNAAVTQQGSLKTLYNVCADFKKKYGPNSNSAWSKLKKIRDGVFSHPTNYKDSRSKKPSYVTTMTIGDDPIVSNKRSEFASLSHAKYTESKNYNSDEVVDLINQFQKESGICLDEAILEFERLIKKRKRLFEKLWNT